MNIPLKITFLFIIIFTLSSCGNKSERSISEIEQSQYSMAVNAFLWRASLDSLMFMPIDKSDPIGGIISTDWYSGEGIANERTKVFVYIKDRRLRADALEVAVFRQINSNNSWVDAEVNPETAKLIENSILTKARELRLGSKAFE